MATSQAVTGIHSTPIISSLAPPTVTTENRIPTSYMNKQGERGISQQQSRDSFVPEAQTYCPMASMLLLKHSPTGLSS